MTKRVTEKLNFDEWLNENYFDLNCEAAESGMDRELDFDRDLFEEKKYDEYIKKG